MMNFIVKLPIYRAKWRHLVFTVQTCLIVILPHTHLFIGAIFWYENVFKHGESDNGAKKGVVFSQKYYFIVVLWGQKYSKCLKKCLPRKNWRYWMLSIPYGLCSSSTKNIELLAPFFSIYAYFERTESCNGAKNNRHVGRKSPVMNS